MKTEMEKLQENTQIEKANDTMLSLFQYLDELISKVEFYGKKRVRATVLNLTALISHLIVVSFVMFTDMPFEINVTFVNYSFLIWLVTQYREWVCITQYREVTSETDGVFATLSILGLMDEDHFKKRRVKIPQQSLFKRFKEFFERVGSKKNQESYV